MKIKRANGTMLILVVAFMLILIVFCMATLAMVTVANNRAVTKFEENQSYYTAASALEIFAEGSLSDETYFALDGATPRDYIKVDGTPLAKMTQGRALELDLYKLAVLKEATALPTNPIGAGEKGTAPIFTNDLEKIINMADGTVFSSEPTYAAQYTVNPSYKYAEYLVELPAVSSGDNYGLFADKQSTGTGGDDYHAKIKVEVLERYYNMAGVEQSAVKEYMGVLLRGEIPSTELLGKVDNILTAGNPDPLKINAAIKAGQRHKDYFRIRVTSEAELLGVKGVTSREYVVSSPMPGSGNMAITNFGYSNSGASMTAIGGISSLVATKIAYVSVAGQTFSGGTLFFDAFNTADNFIAEDAVTASIAKPAMTALDVITLNNMPNNLVAQGYNTVFYGNNAIFTLTNAGGLAGNDNTHAYHFITNGQFKTSNPRTIYGTLTCDTIDSLTHDVTIKKTGLNYGDLYINELNMFEFWTGPNKDYEIRVAAEGTIYTKDLIVPNTIDIRSNPADDPNILRDTPVKFDIGAPLYYSGEIRTEDGTRKFEVTAGGATGYQITEVGGATYPLDTGGKILAKSTSTAKEPKVSYFFDTDGDGTPDYTMNGDFQKEIKLPFEFKSSSGASLVDVLTLETTQSLYHEYFGATAIWGSGMGIDTVNNDGTSGPDGIPDTGSALGPQANGGDGSLIGIDTDGNPGMDKPIYYGVLNNSNWSPNTTATYAPTNNQSSLSSFVGYAKIGDSTFGGVMDCVLTAAKRLKEVDSVGDGTSLNVSSNTVALDTNGGTLSIMVSYYGGNSYSGSISYHGTISESGKLPEAAFAPSHVGSYVWLVDTSSGDITLEMPTRSSADNNIMLVATGSGKLNVLIPASAAKLDSGVLTYRVGGWENKNAMVIISEINAIISGVQTSGGYLVAPAPSTGMGYSAGSNVDDISDAGKITVYSDNGVLLDFKKGSLLNSVLYAPQGELKMAYNTGDAPKSYVRFNQEGAVSPAEIEISNAVIGNVVCSGYSTSNNAGVLFLPSEAKPEDGKPNFSWNILRYLSGQN